MKLTHNNPEDLHAVLLPLLHAHQELDDQEVPPDVPADAWNDDEEEDGDGEEDAGAVAALDDTPNDSVPTTELDNVDADLDGHGDDSDSDVEMVELDPYKHQPDNQLGLSDYESPRHLSEEPLTTPHGDSKVVTPALRKAAHLNPEDLSGDDSLSGPSSSSLPGASFIIQLPKTIKFKIHWILSRTLWMLYVQC